MSIKEWSTPKKIGCGCLVVLILTIGGCGALTFGLFALMKSSDAHTTSLKQVQENDSVKEILGTPIEPGFWLMGSINLNGSSGNADIFYPVSGPKSSGTVYVVGTKTEGVWQYSKISFIQETTNKKIDLVSSKEN